MYRKFKIFFTFPLLIATSAFFSNCSEDDAKAQQNNTPFGTADAPHLQKTDLMTGLSNPWDMAFAADGTMFFTEKCRGLSARKPNGQVTRLFGTSGSALVAKDLFCEGQSGMHGVALDPDFAANHVIYVYMASNLKTNPRTNRVVRLVLDANFTTATDRVDIVTDIAYKDKANAWGGAGSHSGGRIRFANDGSLYITTGDNHNGPLPQDLNRLGGKVLRVDRDGKAAPGNKTPAGGDPRIFTYGHRNVQGICFHPTTQQPYIAEHGPGHSDEVTALVAGGNGGWDPQPNAGVQCEDNYCGYTSNKTDGTPTSMTDLKKFPNAIQPVLSLDDSQGMGPCEFLRGPQWKGWNGALAVGIMGGQRVEIVKLDNKGALISSTKAPLSSDRIRSVVQGPDGLLYVATDSGSIWKVTPQ